MQIISASIQQLKIVQQKYQIAKPLHRLRAISVLPVEPGMPLVPGSPVAPVYPWAPVGPRGPEKPVSPELPRGPVLPGSVTVSRETILRQIPQ